jgi:hypothetical protein
VAVAPLATLVILFAFLLLLRGLRYGEPLLAVGGIGFFGQPPSATVTCLSAIGVDKQDDGPDRPVVTEEKSVGREGIEPPQPEAADLQSAELTTLLNLPETWR